MRDIIDQIRAVLDAQDAERELNDSQKKNISKLSKSITDQFKQAEESLTQMFSVSALLMKVFAQIGESVTELKEMDTCLTEISKESDRLSQSQLKQLGENSFEIANKYGKTATDYLSRVQEATRAGYENAQAIAELSIAIQSAGNVTADVANSYVTAADNAYNLGGDIEKLTEIFDGANKITNENSVTMSDLAEAMAIAGSTAAGFGVDASEATAAIATISTATQQSGTEVADAFKAILLNIRQVSDEEEGIDAKGLAKYEKACKSLGVSLKETKNGVLSLRDPMEVLEELSDVYNKLDDSDIRKANLLDSVGGNFNATALDALLGQFDNYKVMLQQYEDGSGSMAREAEMTADSWEGSASRLANTFTNIVGNIADSDFVTGGINLLNDFLSLINNVTDAIGSMGSVLATVGIASFIKNLGRQKALGNCLEFLSWPNIVKEMIRWFKVQAYVFGSSKINQRGVNAGTVS